MVRGVYQQITANASSYPFTLSLALFYPPLIMEPDSPSHLSWLTQMEGVKLQSSELQISLHLRSTGLPNRGGKNNRLYCLWPAFYLTRPYAQPHQQIIIPAHKGMEENEGNVEE